jgi:hypothetical protein
MVVATVRFYTRGVRAVHKTEHADKLEAAGLGIRRTDRNFRVGQCEPGIGREVQQTHHANRTPGSGQLYKGRGPGTSADERNRSGLRRRLRQGQTRHAAELRVHPGEVSALALLLVPLLPETHYYGFHQSRLVLA